MTSREPHGGTNPESTKRTCLTQGQILTLAAGAAVVGAAVAYFAIKALGPDPDRPPIIVRNGSVLVEEHLSPTRGSLDPMGARTWVHNHTRPKPKFLDVDLAGVSSGSCGGGGNYNRMKVKTVTVRYVVGDDPAAKELVLSIRADQIAIDVGASVPLPPAKPNAWTLSFDTAAARLTEVTLTGGGPSETCMLDPGPATMIWVTQYR